MVIRSIVPAAVRRMATKERRGQLGVSGNG